MASVEVLKHETQKGAIYRKLWELFMSDTLAAGPFYGCQRNPDTGEITPSALEVSDLVTPADFSANELQAFYEESGNKREPHRELARIQWEVLIGFAPGSEAITEKFDEQLARYGKHIIPSRTVGDTGERLAQVIINLTDVRFVHPPAVDSDTGTRARYVLECIIGRK